jgi:hypothetical protein
VENNAIKLSLPYCKGCRGEVNILFSFKFEIFYSCSEVSVAHLKVTGPPNFPSFSYGSVGR